jgi:hypothetical protein
VQQKVAQTRRGLYADFAKKLDLLGTTADPQAVDLLGAQQAVVDIRREVEAGRVRLSTREEELLGRAEEVLDQATPVPLADLHRLHGDLWEVALDPKRLATADGKFVGRSFARLRAMLSRSIAVRLQATTPAVAEEYRNLREVVSNVEAPLRRLARRVVSKSPTGVEPLVSAPFALGRATGSFVQDKADVADLSRLLFLSHPSTRKAIVDGYWIDLVDAATDRATGRLDLGTLADLWAKVPETIKAFMTAEWHAGAGAKLAELIATHGSRIAEAEAQAAGRVTQAASRMAKLDAALRDVTEQLKSVTKEHTKLMKEIARRTKPRGKAGPHGFYRFFLFWQAAGVARGVLSGNLGMALYHGATLTLLRFPDLWMTLVDKSADPRLRILALRTIRGLAVAYAGEQASPRPAFADEAETLRLLDRQLGR